MLRNFMFLHNRTKLLHYKPINHRSTLLILRFLRRFAVQNNFFDNIFFIHALFNLRFVSSPRVA